MRHSSSRHGPKEAPNRIRILRNISPYVSILLTVLQNHGAGIHPDLREVAFKRIVANAPNLRSATVITGHSGCVISSFSLEQMKEIEHMSKMFYTHSQPNGALRLLTLDGYSEFPNQALATRVARLLT